MGLLYAFPVSLDEKDFVEIKDQTITLKTYGLPYIFWGYAFAALMVILFMFLAIKAPVLKLVELGDETDATLGYALLAFIASLPISILSVFFFEKRILKTGNIVSMQYRIFGLKVFSESFTPAIDQPYFVSPYLSSPNVARMKGGEEAQGFQNKGYYVLWLHTQDGKRIQLDRHSRKVDLDKLKNLLELVV